MINNNNNLINKTELNDNDNTAEKTGNLQVPRDKSTVVCGQTTVKEIEETIKK